MNPTENNDEPSTSEFDTRTDSSSAKHYFEFYGYLSQQQNMLQDLTRTGTYHRAIIENYVDFSEKVEFFNIFNYYYRLFWMWVRERGFCRFLLLKLALKKFMRWKLARCPLIARY